MTTKLGKFHLSNEVTEFAKTLGRLTPDKYCYGPQVGDTVDFYIDFLGEEEIHTGVIVESLDFDLSDQPKILHALAECYELDRVQVAYLLKHFDYVEPYTNSDSRGFKVKFSHRVSDEFVKTHLIKDSDKANGVIIRSGTIKAKLSLTKDGTYVLTGFLKCFISGNSVESTKEIDAFKKQHATQSVVENVAWSDNIIPPSLLDKFNNELDALCLQETADYHPGSRSVVRDIVHPSLYCYVDGISKLKGAQDIEFAKSLENRDGADFWGRAYEDSIFQWLPSEFYVSDKGKVRIDSYINNLDQEKYPGIYSGLEQMFERVLPMFEAVCGSLRNDFYGSEPKEQINLPLRNRTLQVIPKIVEYRVNSEENFDGVWHVEGMSHENILATGLCIIKRDKNFSGAEIEFRRFLFLNEGNDLTTSTPQNANSPIEEMAGGHVRPLGKMKTPAKRTIVFPNSHIHRLSSMSSSDGSDAIRRIVVFWLVDPEKPIVSTKNISPQQGVMSLDDAKRYRLELMVERKFHKENFSDREVSLCEH